MLLGIMTGHFVGRSSPETVLMQGQPFLFITLLSSCRGLRNLQQIVRRQERKKTGKSILLRDIPGAAISGSSLERILATHTPAELQSLV